MQSQDPTSLDKKGILKVMIFAILIALLGIGILGWHYRQLEKKRLPELEEKIEEQREKIEQGIVKDVLDKFISARIRKNESQATFFLTERAMEQKKQGKFVLVNDFESYEILKTEKLGEGKYRSTVKLYREGGISNLVEVIILTKILDRYYIDSVGIAG